MESQFTNQDFQAARANNSGAMQKILSNQTTARILNTAPKKQSFYDTLKKYRGRDNTIQRTLRELKQGQKEFSRVEVDRIARELLNKEQEPAHYGISNHSFGSSSLASRPLVASPGLNVLKTGAQLYGLKNAAIIRSGLVKHI